MKKFICMVFGMLLACIFILPASYCNAEITTTSEASNSKVYDLQQNAFKYYQVKHKGALGIPISCSCAESEAGDITKYTVEPKYSESINGNKVEITISQVNVTGSADNFNSILKDNKYIKNIKLDKLENNTVKVDIETSGKIDIKINPVKRRYSYIGDNKYEFKTFIDVVFQEKVKDNSKIIIIDPGHGGSELGTTDNFTYEKQLNLDISKRVKENLEKAGYRVYITRDDDSNVGLLDRTDPANLLNADLFFSVHNNSLPLDVNIQCVYMFRGTTVLYNSTAPKPGREFATILMREVSSTIKTNTYPLQDRPNLAVLSSAWCPAVLMETTALTDDSDTKMMMHRINSQKVADASLRAVNKYFNIEKQNPYVEYAGVDHYPVISGDSVKINMTSKYDGDYSDYGNYDPVQYRVFMAKSDDKGYTELTNGYSNAMIAYNEFIIEDSQPLTEDNYKVMIFVKKSSSNGIDQNSYGAYDKIYNFNFTCYNSLNAPKNDNSKVSNSSGNIVNDGMAVEDNDYVYYINRVGDVYGAAPDYLYKIKKNDLPRKDFCDLSYNTQVIPNRVWNLNLVDDWIYYSNWKDTFHHSINKVKKDGTEDTCIANEATGNMFVEGNWIYYVKRTNSHSIDLNNIYKISLDGTCRIKLNSSAIEDMTVSNDWIYYTNISDGYKIYRMKSDGSENTKICDDETLFMTVCEDTVFYSNKSDHNKLYKINGDGSGKAKLSNNKSTFINANHDYVYYVNYSDNENLYKIPVSGGKSKKITNQYGTNITILKDKIFFDGMFYKK